MRSFTSVWFNPQSVNFFPASYGFLPAAFLAQQPPDPPAGLICM
jgi:hypothetical protein